MHSVGDKRIKIFGYRNNENKKCLILQQLNLFGPSKIISGGLELSGFIDKMNVLYFFRLAIYTLKNIYID